MPATSTAQRRLFAIAEHHPDQLYDKNKGLANLSHQTLHDFAATSEKGLPQRVPHMADGRQMMERWTQTVLPPPPPPTRFESRTAQAPNAVSPDIQDVRQEPWRPNPGPGVGRQRPWPEESPDNTRTPGRGGYPVAVPHSLGGTISRVDPGDLSKVVISNSADPTEVGRRYPPADYTGRVVPPAVPRAPLPAALQGQPAPASPMADGRRPLPQYKDGHMASNTMFQQNEKVRGSQPAWMEKQRGVPHMADGGRPPDGHGPLPGPAYRVRQTKMTTVAPEPPRQRRVYGQPPPKQQSAALPGPPMMADGKKPEKWAAEAFKPSHKGMLHRALNVPEGEKIPAGKMSKALNSSSSHVRHMAQAAKNI